MRQRFRPAGDRLKYIKIVTKKNGQRFLYYSAPGMQRVRLPDLPRNSPEFLNAYLEAQKQSAPEQRSRGPAGSIARAIQNYLNSDDFMALRQTTRETRRRILDKISSKYGEAKIADLRERHIQADIDSLPPHPGNNRLKVWRGFCKWAKRNGSVDTDPSKHVERKTMPKSQGHTVWGRGHITAYRKFWPLETPQRLAFELLYWTGARSSDVVRLSSDMVDSQGWLTFEQVKTGGEVSIPFRRTLPEWAKEMQPDLDLLYEAISKRSSTHPIFVATGYNQPRSIKAFSQWFSRSANEAGLPKELTAHGLRKARASFLAEIGATTHQIAAWTGHETLAEVDRYSRKANRKRLLSDGD